MKVNFASDHLLPTPAAGALWPGVLEPFPGVSASCNTVAAPLTILINSILTHGQQYSDQQTCRSSALTGGGRRGDLLFSGLSSPPFSVVAMLSPVLLMSLYMDMESSLQLPALHQQCTASGQQCGRTSRCPRWNAIAKCVPTLTDGVHPRLPPFQAAVHCRTQ